MFSTEKLSNTRKVYGFKRRVSYEQYPEEKYRFWLLSFKKKLISFLRTTRCTIYVYPKSCAYHPDTECRTFFRGYLKNPKSSDNTMAEFIPETSYPSETNHPSQTDNSSKYKFGTKTNYGAKFVSG